MVEPLSVSSGPLAGIRVVDFCSVVSGPAAMATLADQGADVIKIEPLGGDILRAMRPGGSGVAPNFVSCNRGKRSIALDLKKAEASEIIWTLIDKADVVAQNFRPGAIERLGYSAERALERNSRLVYLSISGVGETGPYAKSRVYDPVIQGLSGLADIQADPVTGRPRMVRTLIADKTTAIYAAQAVTAALVSRSITGRGQHVKVSMLDVMLSYLWPEGMAPFTVVADENVVPSASNHDMIFPTTDGYITLGALSNKEWVGVCTALDKPEWVDDPRFSTPMARTANRQERLECVGAALQDQPTEVILHSLQAADVPCAPILNRRAVLDHPQVLANDIVQYLDQPGLGRIRQARPAARFDQTPANMPRTAPLLGEHTLEILEELDISEAKIEALIAAGAIAAVG